MEAVYTTRPYAQGSASPLGTSLRCDNDTPPQPRFESATTYQSRQYMPTTTSNPNFAYQYYSEPSSPTEQRKPQNMRSPLVSQRSSESFSREHPYMRRSPSYSQYQPERETRQYSPREKAQTTNILSVVPVEGGFQRRCQSLKYLNQYDASENEILPARTERDIYAVAERLGNALIDLQPTGKVAPPPIEHRKAFAQLFFL